MKEWETIQLYYACKLVAGYAFKSKDFGDYPDKVIKITHIVPPTVDMKNLTGVDLSQYERKKLIKYIAKQGDYVLAMTGATIGKMGRIEESEAYVNQRVLLFKNNPNVDKDYLFYVLQQNKFQQYILNHIDSESAQPNISAATVGKYEFLLPSLKIQNKIGKFLRLIDDKINVNNRINDNLEQQAQAIFKSWFIDYLPFNGIKPSDWISTTLGETTEMGAGGDKPKTTSSVKSAEFPYPIYSNGLDNEGLYGYTDKAKIFDESVTVSARGTIGFVCLRHIPYVPIVRLVTLIPNEVLLSAKYLYLFLKQLHISGTGTTQQQLTVPDFRKTEILIPNKTKMDEFTKTVTPIFDKIWANEDENVQLALLRDNLLPKLMSGEIDVSNIQL